MNTQVNQDQVKKISSLHQQTSQDVKQIVNRMVEQAQTTFGASPSAMTKAAVHIAEAWQERVQKIALSKIDDLSANMANAAGMQVDSDEVSAQGVIKAGMVI